MIPEKIIKKIKQINWYRQGGAIRLYYVSAPYRAAFKLFTGYNYFKGKINYGYFDKDGERKICDRILKKQFKDENYLPEKIIKRWKREVEKSAQLTKPLTPEFLSGLSNKELMKLYKKFNVGRTKAWRLGILIEPFDPWGDIIIKENLEKENIKMEEADLAVLIAPEQLTFIQKELLHRLKMARKLKQNKEVKADLEIHTQRYFWIHNSWAEIQKLTVEYFREKVKEEAKKRLEQLEGEIKKLEGYEVEIKAKKKELMEKYNFSTRIKNIINFFSLMTDWRDQRKEIALRENHIADLFLEELVKRTGMAKEDLINIEIFEAKNIDHLIKIRKEVEERRERAFLHYLSGRNRIRWFLGDEAEQLKELLDQCLVKGGEIKGTIASKGKVRGKVKVIISVNEFSKMKEGDILVTQMTRPEYTPILKKAAAIVTDEGGLTCHAAIISRELGIPCLTATQVATNVLKDNEEVEVDAEKGIVRKIK